MLITEFLEARIAEDETLARDVIATVAPDEWENPTSWGNFFPADIAFWDSQTPYRTLAECAAKRKMLDRIPKQSDLFDPMGGTSAYVLFCLAAVYADHPGYDERWAI